MNERITKKDIKHVFEYLEERFGISDTVFSGYSFLRSQKGRLFLFSGLMGFRMKTEVSSGLPFIRISRTKVPKPTTAFIQLFGGHATKSFITLDREQAMAFASGADIAMETKLTDGFVIMKYKNFALGCGHLKEGVVMNLVPKGKRMNVGLI